MATTKLTKAQWTLVQLFSRVSSEKEDAELRKLLSDFYFRKVEEGMDALWNLGEINADTLTEWADGHYRVAGK